jgi:hypothetical protein
VSVDDRQPAVDTAFLKIPAYILCYFLGRAESEAWSK